MTFHRLKLTQRRKEQIRLRHATSEIGAIGGNGRFYPKRVTQFLTLLALFLGGCVAPIALDRAVMSYDKVADDTVSRQLLLNIARARNNEPLHFTALSNIAATFNFQTSAG